LTKTVSSADKVPVSQPSTQLESVKEEVIESSPVPEVTKATTTPLVSVAATVVPPAQPVIAPVQADKPNFKVKIPLEDDEPKENVVPELKKVVEVKTSVPVNSIATSVLKDITPTPAVENIDDDDDYDESEQYQIADRDSSCSDDSGTDDESEQNKQSKIPDWAKGITLKEAIERQYGMKNGKYDSDIIPMDPDLIFPEVQSCSLEDIFGAREGRSGSYAKRTSSAHWDADKLTIIEKRTYRNHMGYDGQL
jgi:hypothetical protein